MSSLYDIIFLICIESNGQAFNILLFLQYSLQFELAFINASKLLGRL